MSHAIHRAVDLASALALTGFLAVEYVVPGWNPIPERAMSFADAGLHLFIGATIAWHILKERLNGTKSH